MKNRLPRPALLLAALLGLSQCKKADPPAPVDLVSLLPPKTQTGNRTFGCLVNGQPWTQAGNPFGGPLLQAGYLNQRLAIVANRTTVVNGKNSFQRISFALDSVSATGVYTLDNAVERMASYENFDTSCKMYTSSAQSGTLTLTRFDLVNRIVSGTFAFTLEKPGCERVVVTNGRFDVRY